MRNLRFSGLILIMMVLFAAAVNAPCRKTLVGFFVAALILLLLSRFFGARIGLKKAPNHQAALHPLWNLTDTLSLIHQDLQSAKNDAIKNDDSATAANLSNLQFEIGVILEHFSSGQWSRDMGRVKNELAQNHNHLIKKIQEAAETSEKLRETAHIGGPETLKKLIAELKYQISSLSVGINHLL